MQAHASVILSQQPATAYRIESSHHATEQFIEFIPTPELLCSSSSPPHLLSVDCNSLGGSACSRQVTWRIHHCQRSVSKLPPPCQERTSPVVGSQLSLSLCHCTFAFPFGGWGFLGARSNPCPNRMGTCLSWYITLLPCWFLILVFFST